MERVVLKYNARMGKKKPSAKKIPQKRIDLENEFLAKYNELCEKYGYTIASFPQFQVLHDGTYSIKISHVTKKLG